MSDELHPDSDAYEKQDARLKQILAGVEKLEALVKEAGPSREASLALTKLEEFAMWAARAIVS